jgi:dienelactone hydrolase
MSWVLPAPTGPYAVGRCRFDLEDPSRTDPYARRRGVARKLAITAWYPAAVGDGTSAAYLPGAWRPVSWMWGLRARRVTTNSVTAAPPLDAARFPLVVFSGSANPALCYAALLEEVASHGYVVAGISHPYESMPVTAFASGWPRLTRLRSLGGALARPGSRPYEDDLAQRAGVVAVKAADIELVASVLTTTGARDAPHLPIDPTRWAAIGHSFGGGAVAAVCAAGSTCRAGIGFDGGLWRRPDDVDVDRPFLQLFAEHPELTDPIDETVRDGRYVTADYAAEDRATTVGAWQALHDRATPGRSALVVGARHTSFSDWPVLPLRSWSPARRALGSATGPDAWRTTSTAVLAFLERYAATTTAGRDVELSSIAGLRVASPAELFCTQPAVA